MRRYCTEEEKQIISRNAGCFLTGSFEISRGNSKKASVIAGIIGFIIGMILAVLLNIALFNNRSNSSTYLSVMLVFAVIGGCEAIAHSITKKHAAEHGNQEFAQEGIQSINGGTIVGIDPMHNQIFYIEDDINNFDGLPIVIDYPANAKDIASARVGERVLIVYHADNQFQLMHPTQETIRMIPGMDPRFPLTLNPNSYKHVPHPNAININVVPKIFDEADRAGFEAVMKSKNYNKKNKTVIICCMAFLVLFFGIIALAAGLDEGIMTGVIIFLIFVLAFAGILFLCFVITRKCAVKRLNKIAEIREVIFCNSRISYSGSLVSLIIAYEWENGGFVEKEYINPNVDTSKCKYGDILYVLYDNAGRYRMIFTKKELEKLL